MKHDVFKERCRKALSENYNYFCNDLSRNRNDGKYRMFIASKNI